MTHSGKLPKVQTAVVQRACCPPSGLRIETDYPVPTCKPGEVLVAMKATAVNSVDTYVRSGKGGVGMVPSFPNVLGGDVAGVVAEVPQGTATDFKPGDRVFGLSDSFGTGRANGTYAQYTAVPAAWLAKIPDNIDFQHAGATPLVALTALQALEAAAVSAGQRVFVSAGAGGVGTFAVQLAKLRGAHVTTSASTRNVQFLQELGADEVFDYTSGDLVTAYRDRPFDAVVDSRGGRDLAAIMQVLKHRGQASCILGSGFARDYGRAGVLMMGLALARMKLADWTGLGAHVHYILVKPNGKQMEQIAGYLAEGQIKPVIDQVLPLSQAGVGHEHVEKGHSRGKVVLTIP